MLATMYRNLKIKAPSQSGKTTFSEILAATVAITSPGSKILILSTNESQSQRLLEDIEQKLIKQCRVPEYRNLSTASQSLLQLAENNSTIKAVPHSIRAVTGNPADLVILDEIAKWDKAPDKIYAEAVVRTGQRGGRVVAISAIDEEGMKDDKVPSGFRGSFYDFIWTEDWLGRKESKDNAAVNFSYHVSPYLTNNHDVIKRELQKAGKGYYEAHMLGVPRKSSGMPVFQSTFKPDIHVKTDEEIAGLLNPQSSLFLCFDPGKNKAAVLGQLDPFQVRLVYLRAWIDLDTQFFGEFVKSVWLKSLKEFAGFHIDVYADTASKQTNSMVDDTYAKIIQAETGVYPIMEYQHVDPGIMAMESFMRRVDGFYVSTGAPLLIDALSTGLVRQERAGQYLTAYKKDGFYEHVGDCARYPVLHITSGYSAQSLEHNTQIIVDYNGQHGYTRGGDYIDELYY